MEVICIRFCEKFPNTRKRRGEGGKFVYTSRWRLVLSEYNSIRARLFNSQALLEGTNLVLFTINEATLVQWFKNSTRISEIRNLMQGIPSSLPPPCASEPLPLPKDRPSLPPPPPEEPHTFTEPEDTTGQAQGRRRRPVTATLLSQPSTSAAALLSEAATSASTTSADADPGFLGGEVTVKSESVVSGTTEWRHRKKNLPPPGKPRKVYSCRMCSRPMSSEGHTQLCGKRYCPHAPGQIPRDEWLALTKEEARTKALAKAAAGRGGSK